VLITALCTWSLALVVTGWVDSIVLLVVFRTCLGIAEGVYWPQQSRVVMAWFRPEQFSRANSLIQYYGQFLSLALGFVILSAVNDAFGWRAMFISTGGIALLIVAPMFVRGLRNPPESHVPDRRREASAGRGRGAAGDRRQDPPAGGRLSLASFGGPRFGLLIFSYLAQAMLFWGITLWLPLVVTSLGFRGVMQGIASGIPYAAAVVLAIPMTYLSDRTGRRVLIASLGLLVAGVMLLVILWTSDPTAKLVFITLAMACYAASYSPNIWAIIQRTVEPDAVGPASGIVNGIGTAPEAPSPAGSWAS
jgi:MFS family permease